MAAPVYDTYTVLDSIVQASIIQDNITRDGMLHSTPNMATDTPSTHITTTTTAPKHAQPRPTDDCLVPRGPCQLKSARLGAHQDGLVAATCFAAIFIIAHKKQRKRGGLWEALAWPGWDVLS